MKTRTPKPHGKILYQQIFSQFNSYLILVLIRVNNVILNVTPNFKANNFTSNCLDFIWYNSMNDELGQINLRYH